MKRRVIKQGHNTLTVTLPRKWCDAQHLDGGDEVDITEEGANLKISTKPKRGGSNLKLDISGLDLISILYSIRNAYRQGYDQIEISFENTSAIHHRLQKQGSVLSAIHYEVNNLVGLEVIDQGSHTCILKDISAPTGEEFETVLRRIFLLLASAGEELVEGMKKRDFGTVEATREKHDTITKFASYCLRMINKGVGIQYTNKEILYHIIATIDQLADVLKYTSQAYERLGEGLSGSGERISRKMVSSIRQFYELFYSYEPGRVHALTKNRDDAVKELYLNYKTLKKEEILVLTQLEQLLELISELIVARMGLS